jgi:hypothetical protein
MRTRRAQGGLFFAKNPHPLKHFAKKHNSRAIGRSSLARSTISFMEVLR